MKSLLMFITLIGMSLEVVRAQTATDYYPMNLGDKWTYQIDYISSEGNFKQEITEFTGIDLIGGKEYFRLQQKLVKEDLTESAWYSWLRQESSGIYLGAFGSTADINSATTYDPPFLNFSNVIISENRWEFFAPEMGGHFQYTIKSVSETVQVPAGTFNNCLKIVLIITDGSGDTTQISNIYYARKIGEILNEGWGTWSGNYRFSLLSSQVTSVAEYPTNKFPQEFSLQQNYPNPFNPTTAIDYQIPAAGMVSLQLFDVQGRVVRTLVNEEQNPRVYRVIWNGRNDRGEEVAGGIYFYRLTTSQNTKTLKLLLLK